MNALFRHAGFRLSLFLFAISSLNSLAGSAANPRERLLMDFGWKFHFGNDWGNAINLAKAASGYGPASQSFDDSSWRTINLPHDWAVELPFDEKADGAHGFKPIGPGFPQNSVAWYRRTFELPKSDVGQQLWLEFDGVFRDCDVFVNGWLVGYHNSGYDSFRYDISDIANCGGENVVAVKVDASQFEGWFYEGAGIYRHVWLVKTSPVAIAPDGIFVYSEFKHNTPDGPAKIHVQTRLLNSQTNSAHVTIEGEIVTPEGRTVATFRKATTLAAGAKEKVEQTTHASNPELWSPESPKLYKLITTVESDGQIVDWKETEFGIRLVAFDPDKGFLLNGKPYELKGTCNHQDAAGVGVAVPDALWYFRVQKLKAMGCNAYRTAHAEPSPVLLDACDRLGMLVMDENRLLGSDAANLALLEGQIRRDRNHPSVAIWSIANEEYKVQTAEVGARVATTVQNLVRCLDPTRPVTYAANVGNVFEGINRVIEVRGWNYFVGPDMDAYHQAHPHQPEVGTEQASALSTRGIYTNDPAQGYVSAYDENKARWGSQAETWWSYLAERPWLSGGFVWTGFDYRGEPTPYWWPCISSQFGILDTCGFPKDTYYYYQSWWTDKPVLHLLPHWNWPGKEGQPFDVWCFSNCKEIELFLKGRSLGRKTMKHNSHLEWTVKYEPGTLSAKGYNDEGKLIAETKVETTGAPAAVHLDPDRAAINADGKDVSAITVSVRDTQNRIVPVATNLVDFDLQGPGRILGVGNGDPSCHEPDVFIAKPEVRMMAVNDWRWEKVADAAKADLPELAPEFDDSSWDKADLQSDSGPLTENESAVFRTRLNVTESELASDAVELHFNRIDEDGWIYVNGQKAGESHDWQDKPTFNIKRFLHPGENMVAVAVHNRYGPGGINQGVALRLMEKPEMPQWKRSVFNGLAQIIVQSTQTPGEIKLTAQGEGLLPATATIQTLPSQPRPCVP